jgi:hypothetical protein
MPITTTPSDPHSGSDVWAIILQRMMPYKHNGEDHDQWLIRLVEAIVNIAPSEVDLREAAIDCFLHAIYTLPNLYLPTKQLFSESEREAVRDRILTEQVLPQVKARIHEFYPTGKFLAPTLGKWVNEKLRLKYLCLDEYKTRHSDASLDNCLEGINERLEWQAFLENPTLDGLGEIIDAPLSKSAFEGMIQGLATVLGNTPTQQFITYVNTDPQGILQSNTIPNYPHCTYQVLIQRLYLNQKKKKAVATEFGINYNTLNAHYIRHVFPDFIDRLILEEGFINEAAYPKLRQYIEQDPQQMLQNCCMPKLSVVNAQFLALRRLRICSKATPLPFELIAQDEAIVAYRLPPAKIAEKIEKFWNNHGFPLVAQSVLAYDLEV